MKRWLKVGANVIGAGLFTALFLVFIVQIVARFGFNKPLPWTDEAAVVLYVWVILWAAAFIVPEREHVMFDLVWNLAGVRTRKLMRLRRQRHDRRPRGLGAAGQLGLRQLHAP